MPYEVLQNKCETSNVERITMQGVAEKQHSVVKVFAARELMALGPSNARSIISSSSSRQCALQFPTGLAASSTSFTKV